MMLSMKRIVCSYIGLTLCLLLSYIDAYAGEVNDPTSNDLMERRITQMLSHLNDYMTFMADKSKSISTRANYREKALRLFIEDGEPFEEDGMLNSGVKMEITNIYRKKPVSRLVKDYFTGLINLRYPKVGIQSIQICYLKTSDIHKIDENKYVCTAIFKQITSRHNDGIPRYIEPTVKKITLYISTEESIDGEEINCIKLGDVTAIDTTNI